MDEKINKKFNLFLGVHTWSTFVSQIMIDGKKTLKEINKSGVKMRKFAFLLLKTSDG